MLMSYTKAKENNNNNFFKDLYEHVDNADYLIEIDVLPFLKENEYKISDKLVKKVRIFLDYIDRRFFDDDINYDESLFIECFEDFFYIVEKDYALYEKVVETFKKKIFENFEYLKEHNNYDEKINKILDIINDVEDEYHEKINIKL